MLSAFIVELCSDYLNEAVNGPAVDPRLLATEVAAHAEPELNTGLQAALIH